MRRWQPRRVGAALRSGLTRCRSSRPRGKGEEGGQDCGHRRQEEGAQEALLRHLPPVSGRGSLAGAAPRSGESRRLRRLACSSSVGAACAANRLSWPSAAATPRGVRRSAAEPYARGRCVRRVARARPGGAAFVVRAPLTREGAQATHANPPAGPRIPEGVRAAHPKAGRLPGACRGRRSGGGVSSGASARCMRCCVASPRLTPALLAFSNARSSSSR